MSAAKLRKSSSLTLAQVWPLLLPQSSEIIHTKLTLPTAPAEMWQSAHVRSERDAKTEDTDSTCSRLIFSKPISNENNPSPLSERNAKTSWGEVHSFLIPKGY